MDATQPEHTTNAETVAQLQQRRADLVAALTNINAQLSNLAANSALMSDVQYEKKRVDLINQKADIEQELPTLNSEIKAYNTLKAAADKRAADARKAAGAQTNLENLQRARRGRAVPGQIAFGGPPASGTHLVTETIVRDMLVAYLIPLAAGGRPDLNPISRTTPELAEIVIERARTYDLFEGRVRPQVRAIAEAMEERLKKNEWKGGWDSMAVEALLKRLGQEIAELKKELKKPNPKKDRERIRHEAADVANFAMMIADVCGALGKK